MAKQCRLEFVHRFQRERGGEQSKKFHAPIFICPSSGLSKPREKEKKWVWPALPPWLLQFIIKREYELRTRYTQLRTLGLDFRRSRAALRAQCARPRHPSAPAQHAIRCLARALPGKQRYLPLPHVPQWLAPAGHHGPLHSHHARRLPRCLSKVLRQSLSRPMALGRFPMGNQKGGCLSLFMKTNTYSLFF